METTDAYLARKSREIALLNGCLAEPRRLMRPRSVDEVIRTKFRLGAALRAQHALEDWNATETAWSTAAQAASGPFTFSYDYQRADLSVDGPAFYALESCSSETVYTASGMAAISALLLALRPVFAEPNILALPGTYGETLELIERFIPDLQLLTASPTLPARLALSGASQILIMDSSVRAGMFEAVLRNPAPAIDLLLFDTTCFACRSGRILRVLRWARQAGIPVVLVRSHNKLDSLGAEYGRLGSAVIVGWDIGQDAKIMRLAEETRNAVRLLGGAAIPAHFPPYVGSEDYRRLMKARVAAILRNGRRSARLFARELLELADELHFSHGLYITLRARRPLDEAGARQAADEMSRDLDREGYPIRHAGSFGFDFAATEWFHDAATDRYNVRVAVPDLPSEVWDDLSVAIAAWWRRHH